jgi:hypothetical protein
MTMVDLMSYSVDERAKLIAALLSERNYDLADQAIDRHSTAELRELAVHSLKLLADARLALAAVGGK